MAALELGLDSKDAMRLLRLPAFARRAGRATAVDCVWHDNGAGALTADGLFLSLQKGVWRLERAGAMAGTPAVLISEAADPSAIGHALPSKLMPLAGFRGRQRRIVLDDGANPLDVLLWDGMLRDVTHERPACRVTLTGPSDRVLALSTEIAAAVRVHAPRWPLAAEAIALARGATPPSRHSGACAVPGGTTLADAIALVVGHLSDTILVAALTAADGHSPEPVHQMRVAIRRLRSALSIFRKAANAAAFATVIPGLKHLASLLGDARDWDVFLAGTGQAVSAAMPGDRRIAAMLELGERRRKAAYAVLGRYLDSPGFQALELALVQLTVLRLWEADVTEDQSIGLAEPPEHYASRMFDRRLEHMLAPGADISELPIEALHTIRKAGKRLRYAAEFFAPLYGKRDTSRFIDRLSVLQEALGHLNDTASAAHLMESLGTGADRQFAAGAVLGFVAAHQGDTRAAITRAWSKFRRQDPFWT